jgi:hypothetical protein
MRRYLFQLGLGLAASLMLLPSTARGQDDASGTADVDGWINFVTSLGDVKAVEPAGARGSMGYGIGAGMAVMPAEEGGRLAAIEMDAPRPESGDRHMSPRFWLVKGLPLPIDIGFSGGADAEARYSVANAHVQWTVFEAFKLPAVALRVAGTRLFGLPHTSYSNDSAELVVGWGFLRYFTIFGTYGIVRHTASLSLDAEDETSYLLTATDQEDVVTRDWRTNRQTAGLRVALWPPFLTASGEASLGDTRSYAAKLSFGL